MDRELLEAAYAAYRPGENYIRLVNDAGSDYWNPLTDDGDALRLAVKLGLAISIDAVERETWAHHDQVMLGSREWWPAHPTTEHGNEDMYAATRRAIVRAAAEIGRNMK